MPNVKLININSTPRPIPIDEGMRRQLYTRGLPEPAQQSNRADLISRLVPMPAQAIPAGVAENVTDTQASLGQDPETAKLIKIILDSYLGVSLPKGRK